MTPVQSEGGRQTCIIPRLCTVYMFRNPEVLGAAGHRSATSRAWDLQDTDLELDSASRQLRALAMLPLFKGEGVYGHAYAR
jgi:hypothetical protein